MSWKISRGRPWPYGITIWDKGEDGRTEINMTFELPGEKKSRRQGVQPGLAEKNLILRI